MNDVMKTSEATLSTNDTQQFISFRIGSEDYAIDILYVREIKGWEDTTPLPNQAQFVRGVLNLRGAIVPVFDLRCRFGQGATNATAKHVVIIVMVDQRLIGLLVDTVSDILSVPRQNIGPVPQMDNARTPNFLSGIITINETMVVLLSLEHLFENTLETTGELKTLMQKSVA